MHCECSPHTKVPVAVRSGRSQFQHRFDAITSNRYDAFMEMHHE